MTVTIAVPFKEPPALTILKRQLDTSIQAWMRDGVFLEESMEERVALANYRDQRYALKALGNIPA